MKQRWINSRMTMLQQMMPAQKSHKAITTIEKFILRLKPEYPKNITATYDAIPLHQADVYPETIELRQADVYEQPI